MGSPTQAADGGERCATKTGDQSGEATDGAHINLYVGDECVERLYLEPGEMYRAEVNCDEFGITVPEDPYAE